MLKPITLFLTLLVLVEHAPAATLENERYTVDVDATAGTFTIKEKPNGRVFISAGQLSGKGGAAVTSDITDKNFGRGKSIQVAYPNGNSELIALYPGIPFVTFRSTLHNASQETVVLNKVPTISATVDLGKSADEIKVLGTGGLQRPKENSGSYAFLALAVPETRAGVVSGWLTHDRGSGVVFTPVEAKKVQVKARIDYGCLRIKPNESAAAETFAIGYFNDARLGLEAYADAIAKVYSIKLPPQQAGICTWYMDKYFQACDEKHLPELVTVAEKELKPYGFNFIQIDDEWQDGAKLNGPKKNFTTHKKDGPYPSGMKATADNIKKSGFTAGIWFMPFAGTYNDPFFKDHLDWFAKTTEGKPYDTSWGGTCLDMTHPGAREHLKGIVRSIAKDWGYTFFKMDGFWTGSATKQIYVNNGYKEDNMGDAVFANPDKTNIEVMRDGAKLVREIAGPDVFLLGCCVPQNMRSFGGSFGLLDAMRVGPDTSGDIGAPHGSRLWFLNGRIWWNDPDCVYVRAKFPLNKARMNATWTAISGQLFYISDWIPDLPQERLDIIRHCIPYHGCTVRPVDVFENAVSKVWLLTDQRQTVRRDVLAFYNWDGNKGDTISYDAEALGLPPAKQYVAFDFWANKFLPIFDKKITVSLPGLSCRALAIRPVAEVPQLLSTSRHVSQGMIDVTNEKWDSARATLSAESTLVANDPYELRIIVPEGQKSWRALVISVSDSDVKAGVKTTLKQNGVEIRVGIQSPAGRIVKWEVKFAAEPIASTLHASVTNLKAKVEYTKITLSWDGNAANSYRICREDGSTIITTETSFVEESFSREKPIKFKVEALGCNSLAAPATTLEVMPLAKIVVPPIPPLPEKNLNDLILALGKNTNPKVFINKTPKGGRLQLDRKIYEIGLGLQAPAELACAIPTGSKRFVATVGVDDAARNRKPTLQFEVYGDVKEMGEKPVLLKQSPELSKDTAWTWHFDVELDPRFKELKVIVNVGGNKKPDWADVVNAGFITDKK